MTITGEAIVGGVVERGAAGSFKAWDPTRRDYLEPSFHMVDAAQIDVFGPACVLVVCQDADQLHAVSELLEVQLTATLQILLASGAARTLH